MEYNLFDAPSAGASDREPMVEGAVLLRGKALAFEHDLFSALTTITERAPLRHMITPGGFTMSVANCGRAGWVTHRASYLYEAFDPENGRAVAGHAHGLPATDQRGRKRCRLPRLRPGRVASGVGDVLRPKSSFAPNSGSLGLTSGGSGFGSTLPLSWLSTAVAVKAAMGTVSIVRRVRLCMRSDNRSLRRGVPGLVRASRWQH
jgi:hypothetical protein